MNNEKPTYYAILTSSVRYDNNLSPNSKLLYAEITALSEASGNCWASDSYFMNLYKVTRRTIQNWLKELEEGGYIKRQVIYKSNSKEIEKRYITLVNINSQGYGKNMHKGMENKCTENTTSINTTSINKESRGFTPPTLKEVTDYCLERNNNVDPNHFIDFYTSKDWMIGKNKMKDWKASIRTWERRDNKDKPASMPVPIYSKDTSIDGDVEAMKESIRKRLKK